MTLGGVWNSLSLCRGIVCLRITCGSQRNIVVWQRFCELHSHINTLPIITPIVSDGCNSLTSSFCVSVCLSFSLSQPSLQTMVRFFSTLLSLCTPLYWLTSCPLSTGWSRLFLWNPRYTTKATKCFQSTSWFCKFMLRKEFLVDWKKWGCSPKFRYSFPGKHLQSTLKALNTLFFKMTDYFSVIFWVRSITLYVTQNLDLPRE